MKQDNPGNNFNKKWSMPPDMPELMDRQDVLQVFTITPRTLQRWRSSKKIPHSRIGGKIFYSRTEVEILLQKRSEGGNKP